MEDELFFVESVAEGPCVNMAVKSGSAKIAKELLVCALVTHTIFA